MGISCFGMAYLVTHEGMVHQRFPVGPLKRVPMLRRIAAAHSLHHAQRFGGKPWGLFLGPQEIAAAGGKAELDELVALQALEL